MTRLDDKYPTVMLYMGKPLNTYSYDELLKIAEEGWRMYHQTIQSSLSAMRTLNDLHKAARRHT